MPTHACRLSSASHCLLITLILLSPISPADDSSRRLSIPRIDPIAADDSTEHLKDLEKRRPEIARLNIIRTMARHPDLHEAWGVFSGHILRNSTLPARDRELLTLRIGWLCQAEYEWSQHRIMAKDAGVTDEEILRVIDGPDSPSWSDADRELLRAVDELHADAFISEATWTKLSARFSDQQMMDLVFTVGQYNLVSMALNSFGVQIDKGFQGFPRQDP